MGLITTEKVLSRTVLGKVPCRKMPVGALQLPPPWERPTVPMDIEGSDESYSKGTFTIMFELGFPNIHDHVI